LIHYVGLNGQLVKNVEVPSPRDIMVSTDGIVYVVSLVQNCIFKISGNDVVTLFAGSSTGVSGFANGNRLNATFSGLRGH
jgi:hypothetical protein